MTATPPKLPTSAPRLGAAASTGQKAVPPLAGSAVSAPAAPATDPAVAMRRWLSGPDPTSEECPLGNRPAAALWRIRRRLLHLEAQRSAVADGIVAALKREKTAYADWERRRRLDGDWALLQARRRTGIEAAQIMELARIADMRGLSIPELLERLSRER